MAGCTPYNDGEADDQDKRPLGAEDKDDGCPHRDDDHHGELARCSDINDRLELIILERQ